MIHVKCECYECDTAKAYEEAAYEPTELLAFVRKVSKLDPTYPMSLATVAREIIAEAKELVGEGLWTCRCGNKNHPNRILCGGCRAER